MTRKPAPAAYRARLRRENLYGILECLPRTRIRITLPGPDGPLGFLQEMLSAVMPPGTVRVVPMGLLDVPPPPTDNHVIQWPENGPPIIDAEFIDEAGDLQRQTLEPETHAGGDR